MCVVVPCACSVFVALLVWRCGSNYSSLVVLGVPSLFPPFFSSFFSFHWAIWLECDGCLRGSWRGVLVAWLRVGQALGMWLRLQTPGFVGTFPPLATWALINLFPWGCACNTTHCHFPTQLMATKSFKNEIFWSQIGFEETDVTLPSLQRFQWVTPVQ